MRSVIVLTVILLAITAGCSRDLSKQQYYEKGVKYLESGNAGGAVIAFKKAIENEQNNFEARYRLGLAYIALGQYDPAEKELLKALKLNPSYHETHIALARAYTGLSKINDAVNEIELYLSKVGDNAEAYEVAASIYAVRRDYPKAEEYLYRALKISPQRISSKIILSDLYLAQKKATQAETLINEVLGSESDNIKALYMLARIRQAQGRTEDVIAVYQRVIDKYPEDITAQFEQGLAYLTGNRTEKARTLVEQMEKTNKDRPEIPYLKGLIFYHEKKIDDAIGSLHEAVKKSPVPGAYYYLGLCNLQKGNLEQAVSEFQKVVDRRPDLAQPHLLLAFTHLKKGRAEETEREAKKVLAVDENNAFAHNLLGSAYLAMNKGDLAMEEFDKAIELNPGLVDAHLKKGAFNLLSGDAQEAEKEFVSAVKMAPDVLDSRIILAKYYLRNNRSRDALRTLNEGLKGKAGDAILYNMIGTAHLIDRDIEKAKQSFEKAVSADKNMFMSYFNLAVLYISKGEKEKAIKEYKKVLEFDPSNITALLTLARIMESGNNDAEALSYYMKAKEGGKTAAYIALAGYYQRRNDTGQAVKVIEEALHVDPKNVRAREILGLMHASDGKYKEALSVYQDIKDISMETGSAGMANVYAEMGDYDGAVRELKRLLDAGDDRTNVLKGLTNLYIRKKDFILAEKTAREIISLHPGKDIGHRALASVYTEEKRYDQALAALKKAQELNPGSVETEGAIGRIYIAVKEFGKAEEVFSGMITADHKYAPAYFYQASILEQTGKKKDAALKYQKVLELSKDYVPALNNLAYLYTEGHGPLDRAEDLALRAKHLAPKDGSVTDTLGWVLYNAGKYDDALKYLIEATYYIPGDPTVRYHLGLTYLKKGMKNKAEEQMKNSIRLGRLAPFAFYETAQKYLDDIKGQ